MESSKADKSQWRTPGVQLNSVGVVVTRQTQKNVDKVPPVFKIHKKVLH